MKTAPTVSEKVFFALLALFIVYIFLQAEGVI